MPDEKKEIRNCPNCGEIVDNKFCPACGQENREFKANFKEMINEYFSHVFNLDSRFYMTIKYLLLKPGLLTHEYFKGRRESYISPLRLYLIISMVYFLTFTVQNFYNDVMNGVNLVETGINAGVDSLETIITENTANLVESEVNIGTIEVMGEDITLDEDKLLANFINNVPRIMFFLLPLAALILKLLYRRKILYYEHVIFLLHVHSFFFLVQIVGKILPFEIVSIIFMLLIILYLFLAMKHYYLQGIGKTFFKMFLFSSVYGILLAILMLGNLIITIFSII